MEKNQIKYYYLHCVSDSLWSSNLDRGEEPNPDGETDQISEERAFELMKEFGETEIPHFIHKSSMSETKVIQLKDKIIQLKEEEFIGEIDVEDLTKIHYYNLFGDMITFPSVLNRIGNLLIEADSCIEEFEHDLKANKVELNKKRALLEKEAWNYLKKSGINSPTLQQISNEVLLNETHDPFEEEYRENQRLLIEIKRDRGHINNLYWACKMKGDILTKLSEKIRPEEFSGEIMDGVINGILIRTGKPLIS